MVVVVNDETHEETLGDVNPNPLSIDTVNPPIVSPIIVQTIQINLNPAYDVTGMETDTFTVSIEP